MLRLVRVKNAEIEFIKRCSWLRWFARIAERTNGAAGIDGIPKGA
jgi:hypothetical protein